MCCEWGPRARPDLLSGAAGPGAQQAAEGAAVGGTLHHPDGEGLLVHAGEGAAAR